MRRARQIAALPLLGLAACAAGPDPSRDADPAFFIGTQSEALSANGLAFADGTQTIADSEGQMMQVRIARFVHDPADGTHRLVVSEEYALLPASFTDFGDRDLVLTLDGATMVFSGGEALLGNGQTIRSYLNDAGTYSGTAGIYAYARMSPHMADTALDTEGFFAFGFETDPAQLSALSGKATYRGSWYGYGQLLDLDGAEIDAEVRTDGSVLFRADLGAAELSGQLSGTLYADSGEIGIDLVFFDAGITGNGFAAGPDLYCTGATVCTSAGSIGGVFYGPTGEEISGVIGFDETVDAPGEHNDFRFVGAAGYTTARDD